jgi:hypothetical protein
MISFFCFWAFSFVVISIYPPTVKALLVFFLPFISICLLVFLFLFLSFQSTVSLQGWLLSVRFLLFFCSWGFGSVVIFIYPPAVEALLVFSSCEAICLIVRFFSFQSMLLSGPGYFRYDFCSSATLEVLVSFFWYIEITKKREKKLKSSRRTEIPYCLSIASFFFIAATSGSTGYSWYDFRLLCCCWGFGALWSLSRACKHCKSVFYHG